MCGSEVKEAVGPELEIAILVLFGSEESRSRPLALGRLKGQLPLPIRRSYRGQGGDLGLVETHLVTEEQKQENIDCRLVSQPTSEAFLGVFLLHLKKSLVLRNTHVYVIPATKLHKQEKKTWN